jgi:CRISPR/Cas system CSM-associated protein Csm3 (group 7 of RAMP superfamily)
VDSQLRLLRITLELQSPLALGSGDSGGLFDSPCALDANGLPCLPGTSLAGALRAWWAQHLHTSHHADTWFGFVPLTNETQAAARRSRLVVSMGHIHDASNKPVDAPTPRSTLQADPILGPLLGTQLPVREHVRLNARGAAADTAKFDRSHVPTGHRFTFQLQLRLRPDLAAEWEAARNALLQALQQGHIMLGGATRTGLGRVKAVSAQEVLLVLPRDLAQVPKLQNLASRLPGSAANLLERLPPPARSTGATNAQAPLHIGLNLLALDLWRVGSSGVEVITTPDGRQPDSQPLSEHCITWNNQQGTLGHRTVVPGSAIKGALAHRTTFHANRRSGRWAGQTGEQTPLETVTALFGQALDDDSGHAGCVHVADSVLLPTQPHRAQTQPHVRLDRFTGGAWNGALFSESLVHQGSVRLDLRLDTARLHAMGQAQAHELRALADAMLDLGEGRLSLGAGTARGLGRFRFDNPAQAQAALAHISQLADALTQPSPPTDTTRTATAPTASTPHHV